MASYTTPPPLRTRKPTGLPSWPLVLVEGGEKTGKSWLTAQLTASPRIGRAFWLDWGEGEADSFAVLDGTDYEVITHDGTWGDIVGQVQAVHAEAARAAEAGEPPVLLVIDSMTAEWEDLKTWADVLARNTPSVQRKLAKNPGAEVKVPYNVWTDVHARHYELMRELLMKFPGIVVITARGKETMAIGDDGKPVEGARDYKVEGHKQLAYDASAWVQLSRTAPPTVIGARSPRAGIRPGVDKPRQYPDLTLDWLVFDVLLNGGTQGQVRDLPHATPAPEPVQPTAQPQQDGPDWRDTDWDAALAEAGDDHGALQQLWSTAVNAQAPHEVLLRIKAAGEASVGVSTPPDPAPEPEPGMCPGSGRSLDRDTTGDMTVTRDDGVYGPCPGCGEFTLLAPNGVITGHTRQRQPVTVGGGQ